MKTPKTAVLLNTKQVNSSSSEEISHQSQKQFDDYNVAIK